MRRGGAGRVNMRIRRDMVVFMCLSLACVVGAGLDQGFARETPAPQTVTAPADTSAAPEPPTRPREVRSPGGLEVLRAYVCEGIEASEPTQAGVSFPPGEEGASSLCCFSEIGVQAARDTVVHVWSWGDQEMARIPLEVRGPRWRTWSVKGVQDAWRGAWHVDITDRSGFVIMRLDFSVE